MKKDIILSGVGVQGILSIAAIIGKAALNEGLRIKQAEVHGMSQRGGDVQSNLRISSELPMITVPKMSRVLMSEKNATETLLRITDAPRIYSPRPRRSSAPIYRKHRPASRAGA